MSSASITKLKMLAVGVVLVLVIVVVFVFQRQQPRALGKLVVYKQAVIGSDFLVQLRWERPDKLMSIGGNLIGKDETVTLWKVNSSAEYPYLDEVKLTFIAPSNSPARWFVETEVFEAVDGISKVFARVQMSLESKSLRPLRGTIAYYRTLGTVRSDNITNAVPKIDIKEAKKILADQQ